MVPHNCAIQKNETFEEISVRPVPHANSEATSHRNVQHVRIKDSIGDSHRLDKIQNMKKNEK